MKEKVKNFMRLQRQADDSSNDNTNEGRMDIACNENEDVTTNIEEAQLILQQ